MSVYLHNNHLQEYKSDFDKTKNYALKVNYFIPFEDNLKKIDKPLLENSGLAEKNSYFKTLCQDLKKTREEMLVSLEMSGYRTTSFSMNTQWRFLPGLGSANIKETSLGLHHVYGIPWLGGSACKGIARQYALENLESSLINPVYSGMQQTDQQESENVLDLNCLEQLLEVDSKALEKAFKEKNAQKLRQISSFKMDNGEKTTLPANICELIALKTEFQNQIKFLRKLFGNQEQEGSVIFFDAFPECLDTAVCIMNPLYSEYYGGGKEDWPTDRGNIPKIIKMLSVENATYIFALACNKAEITKDELDTSREMLVNALETLGAGAKTAVNYGYFKDYINLTEQIALVANRQIKERSMSPEDRLKESLKSDDFVVFVNAVVDALSDTSKFTDEEKDNVIKTAYQRIMNNQSSFRSYYNENFDRIVIEKILPDLNVYQQAEIAVLLSRMNRIAKKYSDQIAPYLPVTDNTEKIYNLVKKLRGKPTKNDIYEAKNLIVNKVFSLEENRQIALVIKNINSNKAIDKVLKKVQKEIVSYL